jgi:hypothetical protein
MDAPVAGLTMGMALRPRVAVGWARRKATFRGWTAGGGIKGGDDELREKAGATV